ncbi:Alpha/Beta hydrolase protein [Thamnocephalis sphaerospora]|uniref:Alpha/Beta hydrolase protein n=1 Tax=Thamnocephalis sphaerospora TaxID=78915 RepID=A0A4P9XG15_9FUNG|nr:Alpha/Beta hydrolase protein [Thamnocephalis sphaerospora]|eukprot:RKP04563.1 Alpha/Beta hydrolase protein [Thamnocephalis sphaerospora]
MSAPLPHKDSLSDGACTTLYLAGLQLDVYGPPAVLNEFPRKAAPVGTPTNATVEARKVDVLVMLHGRERDRASLRGVCQQLTAAGTNLVAEASGCIVPLLVLAFDLPNHGERTLDAQRNLSWGQGNPNHGVDMWGCIVRALGDLRAVMDLFPAVAPVQVRRWAVGGISLGGHITSIALAEDPRIQMGMVLIGCGHLHQRLADLAAVHRVPAEKMAVVLADARRRDATLNADCVAGLAAAPGASAAHALEDRWVLVLHGAKDNSVTLASNTPFINALRERMRETLDSDHCAAFPDSVAAGGSGVSPVRAVCNAAVVEQDAGATAAAAHLNVAARDAEANAHRPGHLRVNVYPGVGHVVNRDMRDAMVRWLREWMRAAPADSELAGKL